MLKKIIQTIIRWLPLILFLLFIFIDRDNYLQVTGFILLLLLYTFILITRILYAKEDWHKEYNSKEINTNPSINKMSDLKDELKQHDELFKKH
tara:strand:+ start:348 stop:626 length:279 start_codon:yes stop_codon:yes gene_type:complete